MKGGINKVLLKMRFVFLEITFVHPNLLYVVSTCHILYVPIEILLLLSVRFS